MTWEGIVRIGLFFGIFAIMASLELWLPRRELRFSRAKRWFTNWSIITIDAVLVRVVTPTAAAGFAILADQHGIGLFNMMPMSGLVAGILGFIILDFTVWIAHWVAHMVPIFWIVHRLHHIDPDVDVTTAVRSHPLETFSLLAVKIGVVVTLGFPPLCVVIFECILAGATMFNHSNVKIPSAIDRWLRWIIITPDMHHIHHSTDISETNSNYGFNFSIWDRLFGTYKAEPAAGYENLQLGLEEYQDERATQLLFALSTPFRSQEADREEMLAKKQRPLAGE